MKPGRQSIIMEIINEKDIVIKYPFSVYDK